LIVTLPKKLMTPRAEWFGATVLRVLQGLSKTKCLHYSSQLQTLHFSHDRKQLEQLRGERLLRVLNRAMETALHRERLRLAGLSSSRSAISDPWDTLRRLTPIGKGVFRRNYPEGALTIDHGDQRTLWSTSGTTGDRLTVALDFAKRDASRGASFFGMQLAVGRSLGFPIVDVPPNACNAVCGLDGPPENSLLTLLRKSFRDGTLTSRKFRSDLNGFFDRRYLTCSETLPPLDVSGAEDLRRRLNECWTEIASLRPYLIRALPQYLLWLAETDIPAAKQSGSPAFLAPYGGLASTQMYQRIRNGFAAETRNLYGTSELGPVAIACDDQMGAHLLEPLFEVEIMRDGQRLPPGQIGEIVITDLMNEAMPLIRYQVGDVGRWVEGSCRCGGQYRRLEILGRVQETFQYEDQWIPPTAIVDAVLEDPNVINFRLDQLDQDLFQLLLVPASPTAPLQGSILGDRVAKILGNAVKVRSKVVDWLRPETNGKFQFVRLDSGSLAEGSKWK
jgi:phenylacetate-CoA ligase